MKRLLRALALLLPLFTAPVARAADPAQGLAWEPMDVRDGIHGYRRIPKGSSYAAWKGEGVVAGNLYRVWAVFMDSDRSCEWLADCVVNFTLEKPDLDHQVTYNQTHLPWPFQDRDLVFSDDFAFDPERRIVHDVMHSVTHPKAPPKDGLVRAELISGTFVARWIDATHTWVEVTLHLDTRGWLPAWLVNVFSKSWPYDTFVRLRHAVATAKGYEALEARLRAAHPFAEAAPPAPLPSPGAADPAAEHEGARPEAAPVATPTEDAAAPSGDGPA